MPIIEITTLTHPGAEIFSSLTEAQLRRSIDSEQGIFIAESPKVIRVALDAGYRPIALLCEQKHITGDAADIIARAGDAAVYTGSRELLASLTGYVLTRGVLCAEPRLAIIMGTEGDGLAPRVISAADYVVRIPMHHSVDSLNVAAAAAVAFWQLRVGRG